MKHVAWTKRKSALTITLCAIIATSTIIILQNTQTTQAALIVPHPGLVGWWRFDEGSGTAAGDSSGNGNNGTIYGATWTTGKYGQALSFNGANNYVDCGQSAGLTLTVPFTLQAWVNRATLTDNDGMIIAKGWNYKLYRDVNYRIVFSFRDQSAGVFRYLFSPSALPASFTLVTVTAEASGSNTLVKIYLNGNLDNSGVLTGQPSSFATNLTIGASQYGSEYFAGIIDEVRIYNRALSATETQTDSQKSPDFSSNLLAKVPKGATQVIATFSWQGPGSINATIVSPSQNYTEDTIPVYQKTTYSTSGSISAMLNIKRLSVTISALSSDQNWNISLALDNVDNYQITVEVQK